MEKPIRKNKIIHLPLLTLTTAILILLAVFGFMLIEFDADLTASLPRNDPVLNDAQEVILNHPVQDLLVLDVSLPQKNLDRLVEAGHFVENALSASGLFVSVGTENFQTIMPELAYYITSHLPILFTRKELRENIAPLLTSKRIYQTLETRYRNLQGFGGIGKSFSISQDPIGLSRWVMKRLAHLHPSTKAIFYRGAIVSADHQHLLVIADPEPAATDTHYARKATDLFHQISIRLNQKYADQGFVFTLTPTGAYRYALDNEEIARKDTSRIIFLATAGIAIMLLMAFPRPLIGLFAFFPAVAGT